MAVHIGQIDSKSIVIQSVPTVSRRAFIRVAELQESVAGLLEAAIEIYQSIDAVASDVTSRV